MTNAPSSRTTEAVRVCVSDVVVPSQGAVREAGADRPHVFLSLGFLSLGFLSLGFLSLGLLGLTALLLGLVLTQPSAAARSAWRTGGLADHPTGQAHPEGALT